MLAFLQKILNICLFKRSHLLIIKGINFANYSQLQRHKCTSADKGMTKSHIKHSHSSLISCRAQVPAVPASFPPGRNERFDISHPGRVVNHKSIVHGTTGVTNRLIGENYVQLQQPCELSVGWSLSWIALVCPI